MAALGALKAVFRRLARIAIAAGVTAPTAYRLWKEAMVEAAEAEFALDDARPTDSRISMLTGVHRKDVRALRDRPEAPEATRSEPLLATVIGRWLAAPGYRDASGAPLVLPLHGDEGPSFDRLVEEITTDMRPRTVLDELLRRGAVRHDAEAGTAALEQRALIGADEAALHYLARNVGDHVAALAQNMAASESPPHLERAVFYSGLSPDSVRALEAMSRAEAMTLLERINAAAQEAQAQDDPADATHRFRLGVYFFHEPTNPSENAGETD